MRIAGFYLTLIRYANKSIVCLKLVLLLNTASILLHTSTQNMLPIKGYPICELPCPQNMICYSITNFIPFYISCIWKFDSTVCECIFIVKVSLFIYFGLVPGRCYHTLGCLRLNLTFLRIQTRHIAGRLIIKLELAICFE